MRTRSAPALVPGGHPGPALAPGELVGEPRLSRLICVWNWNSDFDFDSDSEKQRASPIAKAGPSRVSPAVYYRDYVARMLCYVL